MKQVTSIEPQKKLGSRRLNLFLDGRFAFSLAEELAAHLSPGSYLSDAEIASLQRQDDLHQVYEAALTLLTYRPRSVAELRNRLLRRPFDPELVEEVLERLKDRKVVDDQEFAQFWVENRQNHRPRGGRMLKAELRAKGVDREVIDEVLPNPEEESVAAYRVGEQKARSLRGLDWREFRRRLGDHLLRRGFSYATAASTARQLWSENHDSAEAEPDDDLDGYLGE